MLTIKVLPCRSWIERRSCKREVVGSSSTVGKNFSFCNSRFFSRALLLDKTITNDIMCEIHVADTLF